MADQANCMGDAILQRHGTTFKTSFFKLLLDKKLPLLVFGVLSIVGGFLALPLPETRHRPLPETIDDVEHYEEFCRFVLGLRSIKLAFHVSVNNNKDGRRILHAHSMYANMRCRGNWSRTFPTISWNFTTSAECRLHDLPIYFTHAHLTRMHSSRMRTGRSLTVCCQVQGDAWSGGKGVCSGGAWSGGYPSMHWGRHPSPLWTDTRL